MQQSHQGFRVGVGLPAHLLEELRQTGVHGVFGGAGEVEAAARRRVIALPEGGAPAARVDALRADAGAVAPAGDKVVGRHQPPGLVLEFRRHVPQGLPGPGGGLAGQGQKIAPVRQGRFDVAGDDLQHLLRLGAHAAGILFRAGKRGVGARGNGNGGGLRRGGEDGKGRGGGNRGSLGPGEGRRLGGGRLLSGSRRLGRHAGVGLQVGGDPLPDAVILSKIVNFRCLGHMFHERSLLFLPVYAKGKKMVPVAPATDKRGAFG